MSLDAVIKLDSVSKSFGHQVALDQVSLRVPPGVVFALLGENGAGKTTAIRTMLGLAQADSGSCRVLGLDSRTEGLTIRRCVGYVSERPALDEWMTVGQVGWFTAGFFPPGYEARYGAEVERLGVPTDRKIKQLSKGMRSKVALSLALAHEPPLLILDEPTSGLDAMVRREFLESMVDFTSDGKTVLLSSHQIHEVERVADLVAIVRNGRILVCQPLDWLKDHTTELILTRSDTEASFEAPAGCLTCESRGRQHRLMLRANEEEAARLARQLPRIEQFETRRPSLEDIFVAFMRAADPELQVALDVSQEVER